METSEFVPQLTPRSDRDALHGVGWSILVLLSWLSGGPLITWLLGAPIAVRVAAAFLPVFFMLTTLHTRALRVSARGIEVVYSFRRPRLVPWSEVRALYVATPRELMRSGWRFFPLPLRESTSSSTTEGHVCVRHARGCFYFPPKDLDGFFAAVRTHAPSFSYRDAPSMLLEGPPS